MFTRLTELSKREFFALVVCGLCVPSTVAAYIEPGMVTILWQMIVASLVGVVVFVRQFRLWIFSAIQWVRRIHSRNKPQDISEEEDLLEKV